VRPSLVLTSIIPLFVCSRKVTTPNGGRCEIALELSALTTCFKPAVKKTGFELRRVDEQQRAGLIDDQLRVSIRASLFLIAELTTENRGAYWEAGFAEGLGRDVIYTCKKGADVDLSTHFDTNHHLTVQWEPNKLSDAAEKLKAVIRATLPTEAKQGDD